MVKLNVDDSIRSAGFTEEEQWEMDEIISRIGAMIAEQESGLSVVDAQRVKEFIACETYLRTQLRGTGIKIEAIPNDGYASSGVIRVTAKELVVDDPERFVKMTELASNFEIYPRTDGKLMFALTFYGMTKKVGV